MFSNIKDEKIIRGLLLRIKLEFSGILFPNDLRKLIGYYNMLTINIIDSFT